MTIRRAVLGMVASLVALHSAGAQELCTTTGAGGSGTCSPTSRSVSLSVPTVIRFTVGAYSGVLTAPTIDDYDTGYRDQVGPTLTIQSNRNWSVSIRASASTWASSITEPTVTPRPDKPAGDLRWSMTGVSNSFVPLTNSNVSISTGAATASSALTLYLRTMWDWALDTPGAYSITVLLTITAA